MTRLSLLVDLANGLLPPIDLDALIEQTAERVAFALNAERATIWLIDAQEQVLVTRVATLPETACLRQPIGRGVVGYVAQTGEALRVDDTSAESRFDPSSDRKTGYHTRSILAVPIREHAQGPIRGVLQALNRRERAFDREDERYATALAQQIGKLLDLTTLEARGPERPGFVLRGPFNGIIGRSRLMQAVYERLLIAADSDAGVLLRGETGTGKTLLAQAIHVNSPRRTGPFVTVDCMALPTTLIESELFGHEQGAFTGALRRTPGKVEAAQNGTLFLDEVGDLPLEVQGKLLRLLQSHEYQRVGGTETRHVDMRIVAATHQNLEGLVANGKFRQDLYYRLRVIEVHVPSLRQRGKEEILALAEHFAHRYASRYRRREPYFEKSAIEVLLGHRWPGNVRELEHWIESAVVLSRDGALREEHFPRTAQSTPPLANLVPLGLSLSDATRRYARLTVESLSENRSRAAKQLKISRNRLARLLDDTVRDHGCRPVAVDKP